ncbi:MAG: hypothetical protein GEV00_20065 [Actinophytocola sp.]|nr:hypothetical protein [Actinophytocola sp.]
MAVLRPRRCLGLEEGDVVTIGRGRRGYRILRVWPNDIATLVGIGFTQKTTVAIDRLHVRYRHGKDPGRAAG